MKGKVKGIILLDGIKSCVFAQLGYCDFICYYLLCYTEQNLYTTSAYISGVLKLRKL